MTKYFSQTAPTTALTAVYRLFTETLFNTNSISSYLRPIAGLFNEKYYNQSCPAKVVSIKNQNNNIYTVTLKVPKNLFGDFKAGQFVSLYVEKNGRRLQRTFSISSAPSELLRHGTIQLSISKQKHGAITPWLCDNISIGQHLHVSEAQGEFILKSNIKRLFIAAGSGITPIISMLRSMQLSELSSSTLIFYVRDKVETPFSDELTSLASAGLNVEIIETTSQGHFSAEHLAQCKINLLGRDAYLCGPKKMVDECATQLETLGASKNSIYYELFALTDNSTLDPDHPSQRKSEITVSYSKSGALSKVAPDTQSSLLELAEEQKLDALSGCRIGVCHQCVCTKTSGRVFNMKTGSISDSGEEEIQLCISKPIDNVALEL